MFVKIGTKCFYVSERKPESHAECAIIGEIAQSTPERKVFVVSFESSEDNVLGGTFFAVIYPGGEQDPEKIVSVHAFTEDGAWLPPSSGYVEVGFLCTREGLKKYF
ncbi:transcriptional regulator, AraC family [Mizugakiibacter sediminis]|uniref:Transcriptional regulator, AraC family n=1 Tax=Mizugakiibacter sediminis TaxID=1475481 RepID=A0A0K8QQ80_9GAMM|nr:hypothetical protein [Mizugakiibacter sediminis]GAP67070.1 transcriptional regulator, AraC family [Mizugakiibacter sediminis]